MWQQFSAKMSQIESMFQNQEYAVETQSMTVKKLKKQVRAWGWLRCVPGGESGAINGGMGRKPAWGFLKGPPLHFLKLDKRRKVERTPLDLQAGCK